MTPPPEATAERQQMTDAQIDDVLKELRRYEKDALSSTNREFYGRVANVIDFLRRPASGEVATDLHPRIWAGLAAIEPGQSDTYYSEGADTIIKVIDPILRRLSAEAAELRRERDEAKAEFALWMHGMQDGAILRDVKGENERLRAELTSMRADLEGGAFVPISEFNIACEQLAAAERRAEEMRKATLEKAAKIADLRAKYLTNGGAINACRIIAKDIRAIAEGSNG